VFCYIPCEKFGNTNNVTRKQKSVDEMATAQLGLKRIPSSTNILQSYEPWIPYDDGKIIPDQSTKVKC
jgi:hypothetical protein